MHLLQRLRVIVVSAFTLSLTFLVSCGLKQTSDPLSATNFNISEMSSLHDGSGVERTNYYYGETIYLTLDKLYPEWQTLIRVSKNGVTSINGDRYLTSIVAVSDVSGTIKNIELWYNVGIDLHGHPADMAGSYTVQILQTSQNNPWKNFKIPFTVYNSVPPQAHVDAKRADGSYLGNGALLGQNVFAQGSGFVAGTQVHLAIVKDQEAYNSGDALVDESGGAEAVTITASGELPLTQIWPAANLIGAYDVIADTAPFGQFNIGDVVSRTLLTGLIVQNASSLNDIVMDIACDELGIIHNEFSRLDGIYAKAIPLIRPSGFATMGHVSHSGIYVSPHKSMWKAGDRLVHIETVGSMNSAVEAIIDTSSGALALTLVRGPSKPGYREPLRLWPGEYDMIVDINGNGVYDPGTDLLDGGSQIGFTIPGTPPAVKMIFYAMPDFDLSNHTPMRAVLIRGNGEPIVGATVAFNVGKGYGSVAPASVVTDGEGMATTYFTGAESGQWSIIRALVTIDGIQYVARISIWGDLTYTHNQGIILGS
jgi:hypothetical protein